MNEQDLKNAFQDVVVASSPPPPMDPGAALGRAHRARSQRRASITGAAVAVLVVGVGLGSAFTTDPGGTRELGMGAGPSSSAGTGGWPDGQTDRTATNGSQADRATQLLELVKASVPAGFDTPVLDYKDPAMHGGMLRAQAQVVSDQGETPEVWEYTAYVPVRRGDGVGRLTVRVSTPDAQGPADACALVALAKDGSLGSGCKTYDIGGKQVGTAAASGVGPASTWASYRAANGWAVTVQQEEEYAHSGYPSLGAQPFFTPDLAALAADPKFLLGG
ncbi:hypothetical protein [Lentzea sp.]|uniref:hypothetical protein n=1 Tax=Lentzea sp. TaxID=56099 RepID=UPI002ED40548